MKVLIEMPIDTKFKEGDIVLERGYVVVSSDGDRSATEEVSTKFFRPVDMDRPETVEAVHTKRIADKLRALAAEIEKT